MKQIEIERLIPTSEAITRDAQNRPTLMRWDYASIRVEATITWVGATPEIDTYSYVITDLPP